MVDEPTQTGNGSGNGENTGAGQGGQGQPTVHALAQYVKDLSFENPRALEQAATEEPEAPQVTLNCSVDSDQIADNAYEVVLTLEAKAERKDATIFLATVDYGGLFSLQNMPEEHIDAVLNVHCPTLLFPFARAVLANVTREGGYPSLLIDMIDFSQLYLHSRRNKANRDNGDAESDDADSETA